mgnify:CR=1 FL=1
MVMLVRILSLLVANSLILGCSFLPAQQSGDTSGVVTSTETQQTAAKKADNPHHLSNTEYKPFPAPTLYSLLVAEVAGQRQRYDVSLANYLDQAKKTQDPAIAERATRIAQYLGSTPYTLEASKVWVNSDPFSAPAHQVLAQALMKSGDFSTALNHMESVLELAGASQFDYLALNAQQLNRSDKLNLLSQFEALTQKHTDYAQLWMAQGSLLLQLEDYPAALIALNKALDLREKYTAAALSKARVLHKLNRAEEALTWLDDLHTNMPKHKGIGVLRARILIDLKRFSEARAAFQYLAQQFTDDNSIQLSLALLHMELEEFDEAIAILSPLTLQGKISDEAYFYLARIAELQSDDQRALRNYRQVQQGRQFLPAILKVSKLLIKLEGINAARDYISHRRSEFPDYNTELVQLEIELLIKHDDHQSAYIVADEALREDPDNTNLLYSRGLLAEKMGNIEQLEIDLRHIIKLKPRDAEAINALGYTLANKTARIDEALELIQQALALSPENPAIIDSLGWAYYRLGDLPQALNFLQRAFNSFPDHEVAAHLGEVLWKLQRNDEAQSIWQQGLDQKPDSSIIEDTLERLNVENSAK